MKHIKIGLKLFSTNFDSLAAVKKLYNQKVFDYIELMTIPGSYDQVISYWKDLNIPFILHAPHSQYGFNLSDHTQRDQNNDLFIEVCKFAKSLSVKTIIVHPGLTGELDETIYQIRSLQDERIIVENLPFVSLMGTRCIGSNPEEINRILTETDSGFCLDIVHAVKAAFSYGREAFDFLENFILLKPRVFHLCGINKEGFFDEHLNLSHGDFNLIKLFQTIIKHFDTLKLTLEIPEDNYELLTSFQKDVMFLNNLRI